MDTSLKQAIDKCFSITSQYEGTSFTGLTGSFDGQGFTYGIWGFNFGQGSLQTLILDFYKKDPQLFRNCCLTVVDGKPSNLADIILNVAKMKPKEAVEWSLKRQSSKFVPLPHWIAVFSSLGKQPKFQEIQKDFGLVRIKKAAEYCKKYNVKTERGLALFFDTCVQQGSVKPTTHAKLILRGVNKLPYKEKLTLIANTLSEQANPKWKGDVLSRRMTIVNGKGYVHGANRIFNLLDDTLTFDF